MAANHGGQPSRKAALTALHSAVITSYLERTGMRQCELAKKMGVTPSMISYWAKGQLPISIIRAIELERVTDGGVKREYLYPDLFNNL